MILPGYRRKISLKTPPQDVKSILDNGGCDSFACYRYDQASLQLLLTWHELRDEVDHLRAFLNYSHPPVSSLKAQIAEVKRELYDVVFKVSAHRKGIAEHLKQISAIRSQIAALKAQIPALKAKVPVLRERLAALKSQRLENRRDIIPIESKYRQKRREMRAIEEKLKESLKPVEMYE